MNEFHCGFCNADFKRNSKLILHLVNHINQLNISDETESNLNHKTKLEYIVFNLNKEVDFWSQRYLSKISKLKKEVRKLENLNNHNINPKNKRVITDRMFTLFHYLENNWVKINDFKSLASISKFLKIDYNFIYKIYKYGNNPKYKITSSVPNILPNVEILQPKGGIIIC